MNLHPFIIDTVKLVVAGVLNPRVLLVRFNLTPLEGLLLGTSFTIRAYFVRLHVNYELCCLICLLSFLC